MKNKHTDVVAFHESLKEVKGLLQKVQKSKSDGSQRGLVAAYRQLGQYWAKVDYLKAAHYFEEELRVAKELNDDDAVGVCLVSLGNVYLAAGHGDKSLRLYEERLALIAQDPDEDAEASRVKVEYNIALAHLHCQEHERALALLQRIKPRLHIITGDGGVSMEMAHASALAVAQYQCGLLSEAKSTFLYAPQSEEASVNPLDLLRLHFNRGVMTYSNGEWDACIHHFELYLALVGKLEAQGVARSPYEKKLFQRSQVVIYLAAANSAKGNIEKAHMLLRGIIVEAGQKNDEKMEDLACRSLGQLSLYTGQLDLACEMYEKLLQRHTQKPDNRARATDILYLKQKAALVEMGRTSHTFFKAESTINAYIADVRKVGDTLLLSSVLCSFAVLFMQRYQYERSITLLKEELELQHQTGNKPSKIATYLLLGCVECEYGRHIDNPGSSKAKTTTSTSLHSGSELYYKDALSHIGEALDSMEWETDDEMITFGAMCQAISLFGLKKFHECLEKIQLVRESITRAEDVIKFLYYAQSCMRLLLDIQDQVADQSDSSSQRKMASHGQPRSKKRGASHARGQMIEGDGRDEMQADTEKGATASDRRITSKHDRLKAVELSAKNEILSLQQAMARELGESDIDSTSNFFRRTFEPCGVQLFTAERSADEIYPPLTGNEIQDV